MGRNRYSHVELCLVLSLLSIGKIIHTSPAMLLWQSLWRREWGRWFIKFLHHPVRILCHMRHLLHLLCCSQDQNLHVSCFSVLSSFSQHIMAMVRLNESLWNSSLLQSQYKEAMCTAMMQAAMTIQKEIFCLRGWMFCFISRVESKNVGKMWTLCMDGCCFSLEVEYIIISHDSWCLCQSHAFHTGVVL
jgi:hypothetical protein